MPRPRKQPKLARISMTKPMNDVTTANLDMWWRQWEGRINYETPSILTQLDLFSDDVTITYYARRSRRIREDEV